MSWTRQSAVSSSHQNDDEKVFALFEVVAMDFHVPSSPRLNHFEKFSKLGELFQRVNGH
jgi:hypothetical protein